MPRPGPEGVCTQGRVRAVVRRFGEDILSYFGRARPGVCVDEVLTDLKKQHQGFRIKHRYQGNWIKMYDKFAQVSTAVKAGEFPGGPPSVMTARAVVVPSKVSKKVMVPVAWVTGDPGGTTA